MSRLELARVSGRKLRRLDLSIESGIHAAVGWPDDDAAELVAISAGIVPPRKGVVLLDGERPFQSPDARRRIGALLDVEEQPRGPTVEAGVSRALSLHGGAVVACDVLSGAGLGASLGRPPSSLSPSECRSIALALALGLTDARLLALHEPFGGGLARDLVHARLTERARGGAIVLVVLASANEAAELGATPIDLRRALSLPRGGREARP